MELWKLKYRLRYRFTKEQKAAMAGEIPMTRELFFACLFVCRQRFDKERFWQLWNAHSHYIDAIRREVETENN